MFVRRLTAAAVLTAAGVLSTVTIANVAPVAPAPKAKLADNEFQKLVAEKSAAVVTIKFVMKIDMGTGESQNREGETLGVVMDAKGTVLVSNYLMGGYAARMARSRGGNMSITPTQIKVMIGDDTEGVDAAIVSRDTELDLAWIKIEKPAEKPYVFVDFSKAADAKLGDGILYFDRLDKFFDRVPSIVESKVGAEAKKPRKLFLPSEASGRPGKPVFTSSGQIIGFSTVQLPNEDDEENAATFQGAVVILPAADILSATDRAMKNPDNGDAAKTDKAAAPKDEKAPEKK